MNTEWRMTPSVQPGGRKNGTPRLRRLRSRNCQVASPITDSRQKPMPMPSTTASHCESLVSQRMGAGHDGGAHWCGRGSAAPSRRIETMAPRLGRPAGFCASATALLLRPELGDQLLDLLAEL